MELLKIDLELDRTVEKHDLRILSGLKKPIWDFMGLLKIDLRCYGDFENRFEILWNFRKSI